MKLAEIQKEQMDERVWIPAVIDFFVIAVLGVFPLFFTNKYFNILVSKYWFFCACTFALIAGMLGYIITQRNTLFIEKSKFSFCSIVRSLQVHDWFLLVFWLVALASTLTSKYLYESFWGNEGRYTGLFLLSLYTISYFTIAKLGVWKERYFRVFLITSTIVCLWGITDYFQLDILNFKSNMVEGQRNIFASSIGNINTYTAYVAIICGMSTLLFNKAKERKEIFLYYGCMILTFFAIIMGESDNAYLALATLFLGLPLLTFHKKEGIKRYLLTVATFLLVLQCIGWINVVFVDQVIGLTSLFSVVLRNRNLILLVVAIWGIVGVFYGLDFIFKFQWEIKGNWLRYIWLGLLILLIGGVLYSLYDCNIKGNVGPYEAIKQYVLFNDEWGTNRGYIWRNAWEAFREFSPWKKLVGYGPETFGIILKERTAGNPYGVIFDNAHNEYLQFLLTIGIGGLVAYLGFLITWFCQVYKYCRHNPYIMAAGFGILCYLVQAVVNLNLPIVAPVIWVFLGIGGLAIQIEKKKKV